MARVNGPLHSDDAHGQLAHSLVFAKWKGRNYTRQYVTPNNPKAAKQVGVRAMFRYLTQWWANSANRADWDALAAQKEISAFNAYIQFNMNLWDDSDPPSDAYPNAQTACTVTVSTFTTTGEQGAVNISATPSGGVGHEAVIIFRDDAEITVPSRTKVIAVLQTNGASAVTHVDSDLEAGTYHYRAAFINLAGGMGTVKADQTAVVT